MSALLAVAGIAFIVLGMAGVTQSVRMARTVAVLFTVAGVVLVHSAVLALFAPTF